MVQGIITVGVYLFFLSPVIYKLWVWSGILKFVAREICSAVLQFIAGLVRIYELIMGWCHTEEEDPIIIVLDNPEDPGDGPPDWLVELENTPIKLLPNPAEELKWQ